MKGSLVPSESRVRSGGNGRCSLRLSGRGVELVHSSGVDPGGTVESPGSFPVFCFVPFKSGNRHLISGRSHCTEDERNPPIVPIRGCLEKIRRFLEGDEYVGRGSSQRGLGRSPLCNSYKVSVFGRKLAIQKFTEEIQTNPKLRKHLPRLSGKRLICHCLPSQEFHADSIIAEYKLLFPDAYDREDMKGAVPSSALEPESDGGVLTR